VSAFYEAIGRLVVGYVRKRYATELRALAAVGIAALVLGAAAAFLAGRADDEEE
jgi:hypothetical protein